MTDPKQCAACGGAGDHWSKWLKVQLCHEHAFEVQVEHVEELIRARRQQPESPLELARRLLGPEWRERQRLVYVDPGSDEQTCESLFRPPDDEREEDDLVLVCLAANESTQLRTIAGVRGQCETALARYRERQQAKCDHDFANSSVTCPKCKLTAYEFVEQQTQASAGHAESAATSPRVEHETASAAPATCDDCGAVAPLIRYHGDSEPLDLCVYCEHRRGIEILVPGESTSDLDQRIAVAKAEYEAERETKRGAHDWDAEDSEEP